MKPINLIAFPLDDALKILNKNCYKVKKIVYTQAPYKHIKTSDNNEDFKVARVVRQKYINLREVELTVSNFKTLLINRCPLN
ncbi:MAG: hypothetical protein PWP21_1235 [Thermosediminibacterales bacterium]|nr:hypothetical protein [Thermosediminibacterales bacterium]